MIGVFDSGVGGLSVWREIVCLMPDESVLYMADQAHVPYGPRTLAEVRELTTRCISWQIQRGCSMIVIACNTASAAALLHVRERFPNTPFVGMEPAVKPAALQTHSGVIGVLATQATFQSELFASVVTRFAANVRVIEQPCPGWVEMVENAGRDQALVDRYVTPLLDAGADALVLGCTHFPFLAPAIRSSVAEWQTSRRQANDIALIDPSRAVARQAQRIYAQIVPSCRSPRDPLLEFWTTGDPQTFEAVARHLLPEQPCFHASQASLADVHNVPPPKPIGVSQAI